MISGENTAKIPKIKFIEERKRKPAPDIHPVGVVARGPCARVGRNLGGPGIVGAQGAGVKQAVADALAQAEIAAGTEMTGGAATQSGGDAAVPHMPASWALPPGRPMASTQMTSAPS